MTINELLDLIKLNFIYKEGYLYWAIPKQGRKEKAGNINKDGYTIIVLNGIWYKAHRLIFLMHNGYLPNQIDHIDGNPNNNKIENLRAVSHNQNMQNKGIYKNNTSGVKGVSFDKNSNKFRVYINMNKKRKYFGRFDDFELAELVAIEARKKYHGEFARAA